VFSLPLVFATIPKLEPRLAVVQAFPWGRLTVEDATRFPSILLCGSLIPIVVYRDGDGFPLAKHVPRLRGNDSMAQELNPIGLACVNG